MDRELSSSYLKRKTLLRIARYSVPVLILILVFIGFRSILIPAVSLSRLRTAVAETGNIEATLTASGTVVPQYEQTITTPFRSRIDSLYHKAGDLVEAGERIIKLNTELAELQHEKLLNEYELTLNRKDKLRLEVERSLIELNTQLEIIELQVKSYETRLEAQRIIYESGGGPKVSYDKAKLDLEIARLESVHLSERISNQESYLEAELKELELMLKIQQNSISELEQQMEDARAGANRNGVVTWVMDEIGATVFPGDIIARVADLTDFKIRAITADVNADKVVPGSPVKIRLNEQTLSGSVSSVRPAVENGTMTFMVELDDKSHQALRPNIRVDVDVVTSTVPNVVRIPNGAYINGSGIQSIFVVEGNRAVRRKVVIGATCFEYVEVSSGLESGETVIISDLSSYEHRPYLKIRN